MLFPNVQIFDFVPKIQVWDVNPRSIDLFWFPLKPTTARTHKVYFSLSDTGPFTFVQEVVNNSRPNNVNPYTPGTIWTSIPKSTLGAGDVIYYFKVTTVAPDGTETALVDVPVKPVFTIEENRQKGRYFQRTGQTHLAFSTTLVDGTTFSDNIFDVLYSLGRVGTSALFAVSGGDISLKLNSITAMPFLIKGSLPTGEELEFPKGDIDLYKVFFENMSGGDVALRVLIFG